MIAIPASLRSDFIHWNGYPHHAGIRHSHHRNSHVPEKLASPVCVHGLSEKGIGVTMDVASSCFLMLYAGFLVPFGTSLALPRFSWQCQSKTSHVLSTPAGQNAKHQAELVRL
jgi:hypothetical protein